MIYAYANVARGPNNEYKTIEALYLGDDLDEAKALADAALSRGAESVVVKGLGQGVLYRAGAPPPDLAP
jgi:hypothetical protein